MFGLPYRFASVDSAKLHIFFWLGSTILEPVIHRAQSRILAHGRHDLTPEAGSTQEEQLISMTYADQMARSLPYCTQSGMNLRSFYTGLSTTCHLAMIYSAARCWNKFHWTQQVFLCMDSCGYDIAARGHEMVSSWWPLKEPQKEQVDI